MFLFSLRPKRGYSSSRGSKPMRCPGAGRPWTTYRPYIASSTRPRRGKEGCRRDGCKSLVAKMLTHTNAMGGLSHSSPSDPIDKIATTKKACL